MVLYSITDDGNEVGCFLSKNRWDFYTSLRTNIFSTIPDIEKITLNNGSNHSKYLICCREKWKFSRRLVLSKLIQFICR